MKFLVDNQLPVALSRFLQSQNVTALHVLDVQLDEASDREIWQYAKLNDLTIISKDEDFSHLSVFDPEGPSLIWVRLGNCRRKALLETFSKLLTQLIEALGSGQRIVELKEE